MNRRAIMQRAWTIFRESYRYTGPGGIPFKAIGRRCFGACLRAAWKEYRDAKAIAAIPADVKAHRIETLKGQLEDLVWLDNWRQAEAYRVTIEAELSRLAA
jgi:hypothetical protein